VHRLNRVFFPLRSNVGWFEDRRLRAELEDRLKEAVLLFDEVLVEDGTYDASVLATGSFDGWTPPGMIPNHRRRVTPDDTTAGRRFVLAFGEGDAALNDVILNGPTIAQMKSDYFELLEGLADAREECIKRVIMPDDAMPRNVRETISRASREDVTRFPDYADGRFLRDLLIKGLNTDLAAATLFEAVLVLGPQHEVLLRQKAVRVGTTVKPTVEHVALRRVMAICVPEFRRLSLSDALRLRRERGWADFRKAMSRIGGEIEAKPELLLDRAEFDAHIAAVLSRELLGELEKLHAGQGEMAITLVMGLLGLVPIVGEFATAADMGRALCEHYTQHKSWYAFILQLKSAAESRPAPRMG
jgi:hypothetical protein